MRIVLHNHKGCCQEVFDQEEGYIEEKDSRQT
jgi:hypothetical protein